MENAIRKDLKNIERVVVITGEELREKGMNLIWNVGRGASVPPRMVAYYYKGNKNSDEVDLAIVGKGVTYDSGGLNIKTSMMEMMYGDKGGACAVIGALEACSDLELEKNIVFTCGFAENAVSANSFKPSDILRAMNGMSVEIGNTDAEGRLVMADCMTYV
jgi:leucyl aminopeptidase